MLGGGGHEVHADEVADGVVHLEAAHRDACERCARVSMCVRVGGIM